MNKHSDIMNINCLTNPAHIAGLYVASLFISGPVLFCFPDQLTLIIQSL